MGLTPVSGHTLAKFQGKFLGHIKDPATRGVCFRLTFKWAAAQCVGGGFNFSDPTAKRAESTYGKHVAYRRLTLEAAKTAKFSDDSQFRDYVMLDERETKNYIDLWGKRFKAGGAHHSDVKVVAQQVGGTTTKLESVLTEGVVLVITFYWRDKGGDRTARGHAVALSWLGGPLFFDVNAGEFTFDKKTPLDVAEDVRAHVHTKYSAPESWNFLFLKR
jgi:hypothetical protein